VTRLAVPVLLLGLVVACGAEADDPTDAQETAFTENPPPVGEPVEYFLYTHCGAERMMLGGQWWEAVEPVYGDDEPGSSPEGWGDYKSGTLTMVSDTQAVFEADDVEIAFAPGEPPTNLCK